MNRPKRLAVEFEEFRRMVLDPPGIEPGTVQFIEMRRAFYAGAVAAFAIYNACADFPDNEGVERLEDLHQEFAAYRRELAAAIKAAES